MNVGLKDTFECHVQKRLTGVDGYTQVWQRLGPSIDALALVVLVHTEEGSGFTLQDVVAEGVELGLISADRIAEVMEMLRQEGLLAGSDDVPEAGAMARRLIAGLDATYPKMVGIVLPAYLVQILQELLDGRNDLEKALAQVDQTLSPRETADSSIFFEDPAEAEARRDRFLNRIASIRTRLMDEKDGAVNVQEVRAFAPKGGLRTLVVSAEEHPAQQRNNPEAPFPSPLETAQAPPKPSREEIQRDAFLTFQREKMELERERKELFQEKKSLEEERHRNGLAPKSVETRDKAALAQGESDGDIAAAVARFEETLSLGCPVCNAGKLETRTTDNGKTFFRCDNRSCGFVTWKRPYPFACPSCKNPFLVENVDGLSCPRSICSFKQAGFESPLDKKAVASGVKRVRKVRRVVRKKT